MSTVKAINFQHPSASAANITLASDGTVSGGIPSPNRNILYNGAMQLAQRGTSTASITTNGYYTADRWQVEISSLGTWTQTVENDAPTGSGFRRSLKMLCTTADAAPAAGDYLIVQQLLEGQDVQRVRKGTSSAQKLTLSFWVKSNLTGTFIASLTDVDNSSEFTSQAYTISASATWEKKSVTFVADTSGAFDNDNAASLYVRFFLGAGSNFTTGSLQTASWGTTLANYAVGQTNVAAATNNYWQVTGVQLETGDVATDFEFKSFGQELRECQRYYEKSYELTTNPGTITRQGAVQIGTYFNGATSYNNAVGFRFLVSKRTGPTVTGYDPDAGTSGKGLYDAPALAATQGNITFASIGMNGVPQVTVACTGRTQGQATSLIFHYVADAEL